ncbi:lipopolysaccharide transport system permease protein [Sulfurivirga caldicuralii]|uniref:Transport permease protein n=1 Tax=Sulfurivirga caldicuralii TaxID=364032 RepID=A0A1N6H5G8_9GAMM|nr:ABC transporter permease [Sulfurivirga caldicuralii]SIO15040.1 lipopolysaccharide transport system permease protein [Sulfurivirga caldicuralii]
MNRLLFVQLLKQELASRYRNSLLGMLWMVFLPLIALVLYTFVFGVVLQSKWGGDSGDPYAYALAIFIGLSVHTLFAETMDGASHVFLQNAHLVKKVAVPRLYLVLVRLTGIILHNLVIWLLVLGFALWMAGFDPHVLLLPLLLLPLYVGAIALGLLLAPLAVYVRDLLQLVPGLILAALFLSPVFYTVDRLPQSVRPLAWFNPLTVPIESIRALLLEHRLYDVNTLVAYAVGISLFAGLAYWFFRRVEQGVADLV